MDSLSHKIKKDKVKVKADYYYGDIKTQVDKLNDIYRQVEAAQVAQVMNNKLFTQDQIDLKVMSIKSNLQQQFNNAVAALQKRVNRFYGNDNKYNGKGEVK